MATCRRLRSADSEVAFAAVLVVCLLALSMLCVSADSPPKLKSGYVKLHFYVQELAGTSYFAIAPPLPGHSHSGFGETIVEDNNATIGLNPDSTLIARVKGVVVGANNDESAPKPGSIVLLTAVFTKESGYEGSTISVHGYNDGPLPKREVSIVGGTGKFRLARGWIEYSTAFDDGKGHSALDITAHVFYGHDI